MNMILLYGMFLEGEASYPGSVSKRKHIYRFLPPVFADIGCEQYESRGSALEWKEKNPSIGSWF